MGLSICVGMLADLLAGEPDEATDFRGQLARLNDVLIDAGLSPHREPEKIAHGDGFSCDMWGYLGLHYLRRVAAWDALGRGLPKPGNRDTAITDPLVEKYYSKALGDSSVRYRHLMLHSDAEGFYVPQDFTEVLSPDDAKNIPGGMIGSAQQLLSECTRLAEILGVPVEIDPESDEVFSAIENPSQSSQGWKRYGVETYSCLQLIRASHASLRSGALIVFC